MSDSSSSSRTKSERKSLSEKLDKLIELQEDTNALLAVLLESLADGQALDDEEPGNYLDDTPIN